MINAVTPKLIGIGGMRCGSTSLHRYLTQHPQLIGPNCPDGKETHRFDAFTYSESQYRHVLWPDIEDGQIMTENTPEYFTCEHVVPNIADPCNILMWNAKFYLLLRNPIDRTFSHWKKRIETKEETLSFEEALIAEPNQINAVLEQMHFDKSYHHIPFTFGYQYQSNYPRHLKHWLSLIPRARIHIIKSEDFFYDPIRTLDDLCQFIGLDPIKWDVDVTHDQTKVQIMNVEIAEALRQHFEPQMKELQILLGGNNNHYMWPSILGD